MSISSGMPARVLDPSDRGRIFLRRLQRRLRRRFGRLCRFVGSSPSATALRFDDTRSASDWGITSNQVVVAANGDCAAVEARA